MISRGPKTWFLRVYLGRDANGKRIYVSQTVNGTKTAAQRALTKLQGQRDDCALVAPSKESVGQYLDRWLEDTVKPTVRARTHHDYGQTVERYLKPNLGRVKLSSLRVMHVRRLYKNLVERGPSSRTIRQTSAVLRTALEKAREDGEIAVSPVLGAKKEIPRAVKKRRAWLSLDAAERFLAAAADDRYCALWWVLLTGGLRPQEARSHSNGPTSTARVCAFSAL